jgi:hypothetical protein
MKEFLKGFGVWEIVINAHVPSKKQSKAVVKREAQKNDSTTLKFILDGLPSSIKKNVEECTFAKDLWSRLEKEYQNKLQDTKQNAEEKPTEDIKQKAMKDTVINEDKDSPEPSDCCIPNCCDEVEVMDIEDTIQTTLEYMEREINNYPYVLSEETTSNIKSIFEEAKNYQKENCALKQ